MYDNKILPRIVEFTCGNAGMDRWRSKALEGLAGTVVEIGFGSGLNVPLYPAEVNRVWGIEPSELARSRAAGRIAASGIDIEFVGLDGQSIDLPDESCDAALSTFTLCTIPKADHALAELRRILKPGALIHVLEHGLAPDATVVKWQHRVEPLQKKLGGGCHLTRDVKSMLVTAGFNHVDVAHRYVKGPKPWSYLSWGTAVNPGLAD